jgi:hypothetical protein
MLFRTPSAIRTMLVITCSIVLATAVFPPDTAAAYWRGTWYDYYDDRHSDQYVEVMVAVNHHDVTKQCQALARFRSNHSNFNVTIRSLQLLRDGRVIRVERGTNVQRVRYTLFATEPWYVGGTANYWVRAVFDIRFTSKYLLQNLSLTSRVDVNACKRF